MKKKKEAAEERRRDRMTEVVGEFGPWQLLWLCLLCWTITIHAWQMFANKFLTYPTEHWCARPEALRHLDVEEWLNMSAPRTQDGGFDRCRVFSDREFAADSERPEEGAATAECEEWEYDESTFQVFWANSDYRPMCS